MSSPPAASFLDFFVLEASEYVEQIDGLVLRATEQGPDGEALQRIARALRGSATMARLQSFAELASAMESVGRSLRQRAVPWDARLKSTLVAAIDDLKLLVRAARTWSPAQDQTAMKRVTELAAFAVSGLTRATSGNVTGSAYFATETNNIAAGLELLATRPDDQGGALNVLRRVRALRGVAGVKDVQILAEVLEAAENAVRPLENGERLSPERVAVLRAAAQLLRAVATALTSGQTVKENTPEYTTFAAALESVRSQDEGEDRVIPISALYFGDSEQHVLAASPNPPTTPTQRFRMEIVSLSEHLQRVVAEARAASDTIHRENAHRALRRVLRTIHSTAKSFGEQAFVATVEAHLARAERLDAAALDAIAHFASTISPAAIARTPAMVAAIPGTPASGAPAAHARVFSAVTQRPEPNTLDGAIAQFDALASERLAEPVALADDVVPVDALTYRGRAALDRAIELKDWLRKAGGAPSREVLEELYDLLELARVD
jgi:chemotaxis protein histidine kinase CheA